MEENKKSTGNFNHADYQQIIDIMNEANKYYTPELSEFHVGFEYEFTGWDDLDWAKATIKDGTQIDDIHRSYKEDRVYQLRVKYLDKEDIESLGWRQRGVVYKRAGDKDSDIFTLIILEDNWLSINSILLGKCVFHGQVKNKSRLSLVMQMIGII